MVEMSDWTTFHLDLDDRSQDTVETDHSETDRQPADHMEYNPLGLLQVAKIVSGKRLSSTSKKPVLMKRLKSTETSEIVKAIAVFCCPNHCNFAFSISEIIQLCFDFVDLNEAELHDFICNAIKQGTFRGVVFFYLNSKPVCEKAWCLLLGISRYKYDKAFDNPNISPIHGNYGTTCQTDTTIKIIAWMRGFFGAHGDSMPTDRIIFLPLYMTKTYVFDRAREKLHKKIFIANSQFYQLWKENFGDVVISHFVRMEKCDTCIELQKLAENASRRDK
jgi:hypothetical protein